MQREKRYKVRGPVVDRSKHSCVHHDYKVDNINVIMGIFYDRLATAKEISKDPDRFRIRADEYERAQRGDRRMWELNAMRLSPYSLKPADVTGKPCRWKHGTEDVGRIVACDFRPPYILGTVQLNNTPKAQEIREMVKQNKTLGFSVSFEPHFNERNELVHAALDEVSITDTPYYRGSTMHIAASDDAETDKSRFFVEGTTEKNNYHTVYKQKDGEQEIIIDKMATPSSLSTQTSAAGDQPQQENEVPAAASAPVVPPQQDAASKDNTSSQQLPPASQDTANQHNPPSEQTLLPPPLVPPVQQQDISQLPVEEQLEIMKQQLKDTNKHLASLNQYTSSMIAEKQDRENYMNHRRQEKIHSALTKLDKARELLGEDKKSGKIRKSIDDLKTVLPSIDPYTHEGKSILGSVITLVKQASIKNKKGGTITPVSGQKVASAIGNTSAITTATPPANTQQPAASTTQNQPPAAASPAANKNIPSNKSTQVQSRSSRYSRGPFMNPIANPFYNPHLNNLLQTMGSPAQQPAPRMAYPPYPITQDQLNYFETMRKLQPLAGYGQFNPAVQQPVTQQLSQPPPAQQQQQAPAFTSEEEKTFQRFMQWQQQQQSQNNQAAKVTASDSAEKDAVKSPAGKTGTEDKSELEQSLIHKTRNVDDSKLSIQASEEDQKKLKYYRSKIKIQASDPETGEQIAMDKINQNLLGRMLFMQELANNIGSSLSGADLLNSNNPSRAEDVDQYINQVRMDPGQAREMHRRTFPRTSHHGVFDKLADNRFDLLEFRRQALANSNKRQKF